MGSSKGKTRRRRENFAILRPLNGDFTRENGQNRGPKVAKIRTLTDPPLFSEIWSRRGGSVTVISPDSLAKFRADILENCQFFSSKSPLFAKYLFEEF